MIAAILIFSRDIEFHLLSKHVLVAAGYQVNLVSDPGTLTSLVTERQPGAIVLDCRRDDQQVVEICRDLKANADVRSSIVIVIVEKGDDSTMFRALEAGADRAFHRPLDPTEVLDCLKAISDQPKSGQKSHVIEYGGLRVDALQRRAYFEDGIVPLGQIQFQLLKSFLEAPGKTFRREELIGAGWPEGTFVDDRTVDVHVGLLRKALRKAGAVDSIQTIRGAGYSLV